MTEKLSCQCFVVYLQLVVPRSAFRVPCSVFRVPRSVFRVPRCGLINFMSLLRDMYSVIRFNEYELFDCVNKG